MAVDMGVEAATFLGDLAHPGERKDLEAARIGEDRPVPAHEAVKPAGGREDLRAGAQHEVVGVAEDHLRPLLLEVARLQRLDRPKRANVHKNGGFDGAVGRKKPPQPRPRARIRLYDLKIHAAYSTKKRLRLERKWCIILQSRIGIYSYE